MNLSQRLTDLADALPATSPGVDLDRVIARHRRATAGRRLAGAAVAVAVLAGGLTLARPTPVGVLVAPTPAPVVRFTAAELGPVAPTTGSATRVSVDGRPAPVAFMSLRRNSARLDALVDDPCALPPGATPGRDDAPTPADTCTRVAVDRRTVHIRRWGYAPDLRPGLGPDVVVIEAFFRLPSGRAAVLVLANVADLTDVAGARPVPIDISDAELAAIALGR